MKILIIRGHASIVNRDGYNLQEEGLAKALVKQGYECDIVYYNGTNKSRIECVDLDDGKGYRIYWLKARKIKMISLFNIKELNSLISNYDIIQTLEYEQLISHYLMKKYPEKTVLYHGPYKCEYSYRYCKRSKIFDFITSKDVKKKINVITKSYKAEEFMKSKGFRNINTIGVGLDFSKFRLVELNNIRNISKNNNLLYVGQIEDRRNILFLISVMKKVVEHYPNAKLNIVGGGEESYLRECKSLIDTYQLNNSISFLGRKNQSELYEIYEKCEAFLLPSKYEIFGMVIMESMLFGCPVISSLNGGADVIIKNGENGFIVKDFIVEEWFNAISYIFENNNFKIIDNAYKTIVDNFNWDHISKKFIESYNEMLIKNNN